MEVLNMAINLSITGSIMFFIFLLLSPITKKHFNSSWHYKILILILAFFVIPVDNFIKLPINPISNISNLEIKESKVPENINTENIDTKEELKGIENNNSIEKQIPEYAVKNKDVNPIKIENQDFYDIKFNISLYKDMIKYIWIIGVIALLILKIIPCCITTCK